VVKYPATSARISNGSRKSWHGAGAIAAGTSPFAAVRRRFTRRVVVAGAGLAGASTSILCSNRTRTSAEIKGPANQTVPRLVKQ
jgi:hypothetical protein